MHTNCKLQQCGEALQNTRINFTIIFTSKRPTPDDKVFCSKECTIAYIEEQRAE